jgi:serine/threonine-protein kinase RsbW
MAQVELQLTLPREARYVSTLRRISASMLRDFDVPEEAVDDVAVALSEACSNVIRHASGTDEYGVRLCVSPTGCEIEVRDLGPGIDRSMVEDAEDLPVEIAEDGRGLQLLQVLMDELQFVREDETTTVRLIKRWDGLAPS